MAENWIFDWELARLDPDLEGLDQALNKNLPDFAGNWLGFCQVWVRVWWVLAAI